MSWKIKGIWIVVGLLIISCVLFFVNSKSFIQEVEKKQRGMSGYVLRGDMEISKGEQVKAYVIEVYYKRLGKGLFKVCLTDKDYNQEQWIIANKDGIYVVTPSLNQIYKFKGDWPMNTPKPYLLQTMLQITTNKEASITKQGSKYIVSSKVVYPTNSNYDHEELCFDRDVKVKWIKIYDKNNQVLLKIKFKTCEYNPRLKIDDFKVPEKLDNKVQANKIEESDLPLYPMNVYGSKLISNQTYRQNHRNKYVLEYDGKKHFTIVQMCKDVSKNTQTMLMPGNFIEVLDVVGYQEEHCVSTISNGVEFVIYSQDLSNEEMMQVLSSMQVAVMK